MIEQYTSPAVVNNSQEPWLVGEGVSLSGSIAIPSLDFNFVTDAFPGTVTFTRASSATFFDSAGVLQSAANNVPRFDYNPATLAAQGLLIEESRTNSIRNNTMQGAVAGTPGTNPTNWSAASSASGITKEIVGTGTEGGITYIDIRYSGTSTSSGTVQINPETTTGVAALTGQTWTASNYLKLAGGSFPGTLSIIWQERDSGGVSVSTSSVLISSPTTAALNTQRYSNTRTLSGGASVAYVTARIDVSIPNATAVDFTLRIGLPQLELGAFATSVIPTTTTALTRAADVASVNTLSPWYNASQGTLYAETVLTGSFASRGAAALNGGSSTNEINMRWASGRQAQATINDAGVGQVNIAPAGYSTLNTIYKRAFGFAANDFEQVINGTSVGTDVSGSIPTVTRLSIGTNSSSAGDFLCGYVRRITYYPRKLSSAELQAITA